MRKYRTILMLGAFLLVGLCLVITLLMFGSGLTLWLGWQQTAGVSPTPRPTRRPARLTLATPTAALPSLTATVAPTAVPSPTPTPSPQPTDTATPTALPPSPTPLPPTVTPTPSPRPPAATSTPTTIPTPSFAFTVLETEKFPTSHPNFDVYIAVTGAENTPLSGYRVLGIHSGGLQLESRVSASDWSENSGAMHYKAGNIKYEVFNSPDGVWTLQLVDEAGQPVAPPLEFPFDPANPTWYFILYRRTE